MIRQVADQLVFTRIQRDGEGFGGALGELTNFINHFDPLARFGKVVAIKRNRPWGDVGFDHQKFMPDRSVIGDREDDLTGLGRGGISFNHPFLYVAGDVVAGGTGGVIGIASTCAQRCHHRCRNHDTFQHSCSHNDTSNGAMKLVLTFQEYTARLKIVSRNDRFSPKLCRVPPLHSLVAFAVASLALLIIPGPAVIYILNRSVADGRRMGLAAVCGLEIGNFIHVIAATAGLSAVLATSATAFSLVKWLGAGYLIYVGIHTLTRKPTALNNSIVQSSLRRSFLQGVVVNTLNPKVALFFLSFLPQFINASRGSPAIQSFLLGSIFVLLGFLSDGAYAFVASGLRDRLLHGRTLPIVQRYVAGVVFILLGLVAGSTSRN